MRRHAFAALLLLAAAPASAQRPGPDSAEVRTSASAERTVPADVATLTLSYWATGKTPAEGGARLALKTDSVRRAMAAIGIPRDSIFTGSRWRWWGNRVQPQPRSQCVPDPARGGCVTRFDTTYQVRESLTLRIHDLKQVGPAIDAALALGIIEIPSLEFGATDTRAAYAEALREATLRVGDEARIIAEASGGRLGRVLSLGTTNDWDDPYRGGISSISIRGASTQSAASDETEVTAPGMTVRATVYGRWQLLPGR